PTVDFPASSPYVIACGGTSLASSIETAWSWNSQQQWGCGSGASNTFPMPSWQSNVVVFPTGTTPLVSNLKGKRALPDISLNADPLSGYTIYFNGKLLLSEIGGTSCVAPLFSAFLGIVNLQYGSIPFGNYLYASYVHSSGSFNDITSGSNDNLKKSVGVWNCGKGFDLCCGLGSFNGSKLATALTTSGLKPFSSIIAGASSKKRKSKKGKSNLLLKICD